MKTYCVLIPVETIDEAAAIFMTKWNIVHAWFWKLTLDELHESLKDTFAVEILSTHQTLYFCFTASGATATLLRGFIYTEFPDAEIREVADFTEDFDEHTEIMTAEMRLAKDYIHPLKYQGWLFDSMQPMCTALSKLPADDTIIYQMICRPVPDTGLMHAHLAVRRLIDRLWHLVRIKYWFKSGVRKAIFEEILKKSQEKLYDVNLRVAALSHDVPEDRRPEKSKELRGHLKAVLAGLAFQSELDMNSWVMRNIRRGPGAMRRFQRRSLIRPVKLKTHEMTNVWHVPSLGVAKSTAQVLSPKGAPPMTLPCDQDDSEICFFGHTNYREQQIPFGIRREDRKRHMYVVGKSGAGESCLIQLLVKNDIDHGHGLAVLDPHGDLIDDILRLIPSHRVNDVVLFDPSDVTFPPSFNPMARVDAKYRMRVTTGFVEIFRKVFGADWSDRMDHVLRFATLALLSTPGSTILSLRRMFADEDYRRAVIESVEDTAVKNFWTNEFVRRKSEFEEIAISPLLNRLSQLVASSTLRNIFGQPINRFNFREIMDKRKILLMKVSKGILGENNASLLGAMTISKIYEAAMSRADLVNEQRPDFYFYVDEFQNFATDSFDDVLSEARKYGLSLTVANQFLGQLPTSIRNSIFGNVGNILSFGVGGEDAGILSREFHPRFAQEGIMNLPKRDFIVKMSIQGEVHEAFSGRTLEVVLPKEEQCHVGACVNHSRKHYSLPEAEVKEFLKM